LATRVLGKTGVKVFKIEQRLANTRVAAVRRGALPPDLISYGRRGAADRVEHQPVRGAGTDRHIFDAMTA